MVKIVRPRQRPDSNQLVYQMLNSHAGPTPPVSFEEQAKFAHHHVRCDECANFPIIGTRFKCTTRADFDLCSSCEKKKTQPFPMVKIYDPKHSPSLVVYNYCGEDTKVGVSVPVPDYVPVKAEMLQEAIQVHRSITCDGCGAKPIQGVRYKCTVRNDFDLCSTCEAKSVQPYPMVKIVRPRQRPDSNQLVYQMSNSHAGPTPPVSFEEQAKFAHHHVSCDECANFPIIGTRFKCTTRADFDLCSSCEKKKTQPFPMVKIYDPKHHPIVVSYSRGGAHDYHAQGKSCKFFDRVFPNSHGRRHFYQANPLRFNDHRERKGYGPPQGFNSFVRAMDCTAAAADCGPAGSSKLAMRFVKDVTYPDGTSTIPGAVMVKTWRVRNDGLSAWPQDVLLVSAGGDELSREGASAVFGPLSVGEELDLSVAVVAPSKEGRYVSYYRLQTKEGRNFGQRLWIDFIVSPDESMHKSCVTESPTEAVTASCSSVEAVTVDDSSEMVLPTAVETSDEDGAWVSISPTEEDFIPSAIVATVLPDASQMQAEDVDSDEEDADDELFHPSHATVYWEDTEASSEASLEQDSSLARWGKELALLEEMGFSQHTEIVPLLEMYVGSPGPANTAGLQQVVAVLLGLHVA